MKRNMKRLFRKLFPSKEYKAYLKMHRRHRKELIKHAKETSEWDWSFLHDSVIMQIRHMYEYYTVGNNVMQADESRLPIVEQLKHILDLEDNIHQLEDEYCNIDWVNRTENPIKEYLSCTKKEQELYEEIYSSIGKHLQWWWD